MAEPTQGVPVRLIRHYRGPGSKRTSRIMNWHSLSTTLARWLAGMLMLTHVGTASSPAARAAANIGTGTSSGLPVPRFVSLKSDRVNVRSGPTKDNDVSWVYTRAGLPVEITAEYENWRRIRDWEGAEGWVYHSLLSGRRMALVFSAAKSKSDLVPLYGET